MLASSCLRAYEPVASPALKFQVFDAQWIEELHSWFTSPQDIIFWSGYRFEFTHDRHYFSEQLRLHQIPAYALVSDSDDLLLGFGQMMSDYERCHLVRIAVNPMLRGRGYGKKLIKCLCAQGKRKFNPQYYSLFVNQANHAAVRLYESEGFQKTNYTGAMPNSESRYMEKPAVFSVNSQGR